LKRKGRKQESRSVIPSILSHSFYSQSFLLFSVIPSILSHSFYSQSFLLFSVILYILSHSLSLTPPVGDHLLPFLLLLRAGSLCSASAVPAAPSLPVAPLRLQCARSRPTDQPRWRPHLLEAEPPKPGLRKSVARSAFTVESVARTPRASPLPLNHQAASPVTSLNRDRNPSHAQLALADRHCR
jgi:hypothetical protein